MPNKHALLSASSAARWLVCTAAPRYEEQFPDDASEYAEEGSLAHNICELKVLNKFTAALNQNQYTYRLRKLKKEPLYSAEMDRTSDFYLDHLAEKAMMYAAPPLVGAEVQVSFTDYVPEGFGTCDCVMVGGNKLDITDYKHGVGVTVSAENNAQMRLYALGALAKYAPFYAGLIQQVRMTVVQPRAMNDYDRITSETLTPDELKAWGESIKPVAQKAFDGYGEFVPYDATVHSSDHCRFCRGRAQCRARAEKHSALEDFKDLLLPTAENIATADQAAVLTLTEIGDLLTRGKSLVKWYADLEEFALKEILDGKNVDGWKAVAGTSRRAFSDTDKAVAAVLAAGYDEAVVYERKAKSLAELEKLMGKKDFSEKIGEYVVKPPGKPTLVPLSDKREPYCSAAADFAGAGPPATYSAGGLPF